MQSTPFEDHDDLLRRPRILRREWNRRRPRISKSTSLPSLALVPVGRPLFTCRRCGFSNVYVPLCLWCTWSSTDTTRDFESAVSRVRPRSISAPMRPKIPWAARPSGSAEHAPPRLNPPRRSASSGHELASLGVPTATELLLTIIDGRFQSPPPLIIPRNARLNPKPLRRRPNLAPLIIQPPLTTPKFTHIYTHSSGPLQPASAPFMHTTFPDPAALPPILSTTPTQTLRRKQRLTVLRKKSSRSLRSRASTTTLPVVRHSPDASSHLVVPPPRTRPESTPPMSDSTVNVSPGLSSASTPMLLSGNENVRLGHPSRPYYTAIRRNMAPSSNPISTPPPTSAHHAHTVSLPVRSSTPLSFTGHYRGSLSGEMELHMELAARRSGESSASVPHEYSFYFDEQRKGGRVRKIGSELWGFLSGRGSAGRG